MATVQEMVDRVSPLICVYLLVDLKFAPETETVSSADVSAVKAGLASFVMIVRVAELRARITASSTVRAWSVLCSISTGSTSAPRTNASSTVHSTTLFTLNQIWEVCVQRTTSPCVGWMDKHTETHAMQNLTELLSIAKESVPVLLP